MPYLHLNGRRRVLATLCCLMYLSGHASAAPPDWIAVDTSALARMRGGFTTASGLDVSLGLERLVSINGQIVSRTSFQIASLSSLTPAQLRDTRGALSDVHLIQNGSGNTDAAVFGAGTLGGTIIQNTLSDQQIESRTVINASVNSSGLLKSINFNASLSDAIARTAGNR